MGRAVVITIILALALSGADKKKKPPDVTVMEVAGRRDAGKITLDGKVRNTSDKAINGLLVVFDFLSSDRVILTTQKGPVEDEVVEPGQESSFHLICEQPPRAVRFQINSVDRSGRDLRVGNAGPFAID